MKIAKLYLLILLLLCCGKVGAQTIGDMIIGVGKIDISLKDAAALESAISSLITSSAVRAGLLSSQLESARFKTNVTSTQTDGDRIQINGIPLWVAEIQYDFSIVESASGNQFASYTITTKQTGDSESDLVRQSAKNLNTKRNAFSDFLKKTKEQIISYYSENLDRLIGDANLFKAQHDYDSAMKLLGQIPRETPGYEKVQRAIELIYREKLDYECDSRMIRFNVLRGQKKYDEAIEMLLELPNGSSCQSKSSGLIDEIKNDVCSIYIQNAESNHRLGNNVGALQNLLGLDQLTPSCTARKDSLEITIQSRIDEATRLEWEQKQKEYNDRIELVNKQIDNQKEIVSMAIQSESKLRAKKMELDHQVALKANETNSQSAEFVINPSADYVLIRARVRDNTKSAGNRYINAYYSRIMQ